MARSRRGPRTRLDQGERTELRALKKAGYKPRGPVTPRKLQAAKRRPGMAEVAAGRAKAIKVGRKEVGKWQATGFPTKGDRVIIPARAGKRINVSRGKITETDVRTGEKGRIEPVLPGQVPQALREAKKGEVVTVETRTGYLLPGAHASPGAAYRHIEQSPRMKKTRATLVINYRRRSEYQRILEEQRRKYVAERARQTERQRVRRERDRRRLARSVRGVR